MKKMIIKSVIGSFLIATSINLFMIPEFCKTIGESGLLLGIKAMCVMELFLMVVILLFWFGVVFLVKAIEGWCE